MRSLSKFYPSLEISHNLLMGLGVLDFVSVGHIYAQFSIKSKKCSVSVSDYKMPISASRRVSDLPSPPLMYLAPNKQRVGRESEGGHLFWLCHGRGTVSRYFVKFAPGAVTFSSRIGNV